MQPAAFLNEPMNPIVELPYVYSQDHAVFSYDELFFRYPVRMYVHVRQKQTTVLINLANEQKIFFIARNRDEKGCSAGIKGLIHSFI